MTAKEDTSGFWNKPQEKSLNERCRSLKEEKEKFYASAFESNPQTPARLRKAAERICEAYGIRGICDPMYIVNLVALELGMGDGQSNFFDRVPN